MKSTDLRSRLGSFVPAFQGLKSLVAQEPNARIHLVATISVLVLGWVHGLSSMKWGLLVFALALVWVAEALNTCVEMLCDLWCKEQYHPKVKIIKDIAAGAVLVATIAAVAIAGILFL
ncbi:MAG: diacylglycerol kinase family protein [Bacteroidetes bacterium]|nr:diacylglycerol kinase family protein [Bacteroidota bacterium]